MSLVSKLRHHIQDERSDVKAFAIRCVDKQASGCILDIAGGVLRTTVIDGSSSARELVINLDDSNYDTLGKLVSYLEAQNTYEVSASDDMEEGHPSADLEELSGADIHDQTRMLHVHRFAEDELQGILEDALARHNPGYTPETLPVQEEVLVLHLAKAEVARTMATSGAKRKGLGDDVDAFLRIADMHEAAYSSDMRRLKTALPSPTSANQNIDTRGDVVVSEVSIFSLRNGTMAPSSANIPPRAPILMVPEGPDVEDYGAIIRWQRSTQPTNQILAIELWRDTTPNIRRTRDPDVYPTTSKRVWSSAHGGSIDPEGMGKVGHTDGVYKDGLTIPVRGFAIPQTPALEPGTEYYYQMWVFDRNGESAVSDVVSVTTMPPRAEFIRVSEALSTRTGPRSGGTAVTIEGYNFDSKTEVLFGGVPAGNVTFVDSTTLTCTSPTVGSRSEAIVDVILRSTGSKLIDVYPRAWVYT